MTAKARRSVILRCASVILATACGGRSTPPPSRDSAADSLIGTWRAVQFVVRSPSDSPAALPFGLSPRGYLVYDRTGHVFFQVLRPAAADSLRRVAWDAVPDSALRRLLSGFSAFFGTYSVNPAARMVTHRIEGELLPSAGSWELAMPYRLAGDSLILGADSLRRWVFHRVH